MIDERPFPEPPATPSDDADDTGDVDVTPIEPSRRDLAERDRRALAREAARAAMALTWEAIQRSLRGIR